MEHVDASAGPVPVDGSWTSVVLPARSDTPRRARALVLARCRAAGIDPELCDTVQLLTSELVTNAVWHARSPVRLGLQITEQRVLVEASDDDSRHPVVGGLATDALGGRGVAIIDAVATAWGVRDEPVGKTVWFALDTDR